MNRQPLLFSSMGRLAAAASSSPRVIQLERHCTGSRSAGHFPKSAVTFASSRRRNDGRQALKAAPCGVAVASAASNHDGAGARIRPPPQRKLPSSAVTYSASVSTDLPLKEPPWASFDDYLEDRQRVFRAMFPDQRRSQRLNDEEWRIRMLPIQFLLVSAYPIVDMRLRCSSPSSGASPSGVPHGITKVLELQATRWELQGLDSVYMPPHFELNVQGVLFPDRSRGRGESRLRGHLKMSISLVLPAVLALLPDEVLRSVAESVLTRLVERMKQEVDVSLLADFSKFGKQMLKQQRTKAISCQPTAISVKGDHFQG